jgi:tetratricopeptide (TPR) repeat protein
MKLACLLGCAATAFAAAAEPAVLSPAEKMIASAERTIAGQPNAEAYNRLALALARRARETADPVFYDRARKALDESFRIAPENFEGQKARVWILLGKHEFADALREATALNHRAPDDLMVYAMLVDANAELGNYGAAEIAAQWLLDLRPGTVIGLTRAAYLRELFGDLDGAIELMSQAYDRTPATETEDRAWLLTQLAHLQRLSARPALSEALLAEALRLFPNYHYALAELAKMRLGQKRYADAITLLQQRFAAAPHPENEYALAEALERAGRRGEARTAFQEFEKKARAESSRADNANSELIFYYVDHAHRPREALELAEREMERRPDVYTRDAYACALLANRRRDEARQQLEKALAVGTRDPLLLEHAQRVGLDRKSAG